MIYTGGMAGATTQAASQNGVNGATVVLGNLFTSATGLFLTNGIMPGDILTITGGPNAGSYTVQAVQSNTTLIINPLTPWPAAPSAGETWALTSQVGGFLSLYPVVAKAADIQAAYYWRNRDKFGLMSMGVGGGNVAFNTLRPLDLTYGASGLITEVQTMLQPYRNWVGS